MKRLLILFIGILLAPLLYCQVGTFTPGTEEPGGHTVIGNNNTLGFGDVIEAPVGSPSYIADGLVVSGLDGQRHCTPSRQNAIAQAQQKFKEANGKTYEKLKETLEQLKKAGVISARDYELITDNLLSPFHEGRLFVDKANLEDFGKDLAKAYVEQTEEHTTYSNRSGPVYYYHDYDNVMRISDDAVQWVGLNRSNLEPAVIVENTVEH